MLVDPIMLVKESEILWIYAYNVSINTLNVNAQHVKEMRTRMRVEILGYARCLHFCRKGFCTPVHVSISFGEVDRLVRLEINRRLHQCVDAVGKTFSTRMACGAKLVTRRRIDLFVQYFQNNLCQVLYSHMKLSMKLCNRTENTRNNHPRIPRWKYVHFILGPGVLHVIHLLVSLFYRSFTNHAQKHDM